MSREPDAPSTDPPDSDSPESGPPAHRGVLAWFVHNRVAAGLVLTMLVIGGLLTIPQIEQEVFPEVTLPIVTVRVPYPGASPSEVEQGVILAIEDAVRGLDGVKEVRSVAAEGVGVVAIEALLGADEQLLLDDVQSAVGRIVSFPEDAEEPEISLATNRVQVVSLIFFGDIDDTALRDLAERARDDLLADDRITYVELPTARPLEISVEVPRDTLRRYGLTLDEVAARVGAASVEVPGGEVETEGGDVLLRTATRRTTGEALRDVVVVAQPDGALVRLADIATIEDAFQDVDQEAYFDGAPAIRLDIYRVGRETPTEVSQAAYDYVAAVRPRLPAGVDVKVWADQSTIFTDRVDLLLGNGYLGLVLVLALLGLTLSPRLAFWVTLGIPVSFLGSLLLLPAFDVSINIISLFAFIITLGLVVDDAIVVGESIHQRRENGEPPEDAAIRGSADVARPVIFAVLTTCIAFAPMLFVPGSAGELFRNIPIVVILVLACSLVESLLVLPSHLAHPMPRPLAWILYPFFWLLDRIRRLGADRGMTWLSYRAYPPIARVAIRWRYLTVAIATFLLMGGAGLWIGGRIDFTFLPKIEDDEVAVTLELPVGTPTSHTREAMERLVDAARRVAEGAEGDEPLLRGVYAQVGASAAVAPDALTEATEGGGHMASVLIDLGPSGERQMTSSEFVDRWREEVGAVPGAEQLVFSFTVGATAGADIDLRVSHPDEAQLYRAADDIAEALSNYAGVRDIDDGYTPGKEQLDLDVTAAGRALGITEAALASQVRASFYGTEAYRVQRGRNEVRVYVRLPDAQRASLDDIESIILRTPDGGEVPLTDAANVVSTRAYTSIERAEGRRVVHVTGNVYGEANANDVIAALGAGELPDILRRYGGLRVEPGGEQQNQNEALGSLFGGFAIALVVIFGLLAVAFRSYLQPLVVMIAIPFGAIGAVLGHMALGYDLSLSSMMGLVALAGVVVNDSLLLVVTVNELRERSVSVDEALLAAGARRLRPILLTSLTTFLGLAPIIFETSVQARFLVPMALSLGFGLLFASAITVLLVPALYRILEDLTRRSERGLTRVFGGRAEAPSEGAATGG